MAETDAIRIRQPRFRSVAYPGIVGGTGDPRTGNIVPPILFDNPNAAAAQQAPQSDTLPAQPQTNLANIKAPETPTIGTLAGEVGKAAIPFATTNIGANAGPLVERGEDLGSAIAGGTEKFGKEVADFGSKIFGGGEAAPVVAAGAPGGGVPTGRFIPTGEVQALPTIESGSQVVGHIEGAAAAGGATGGGAGGASPSFGESLTSSGTLGGAIGAGAGTFIVGLISGRSPAEAAKSGAAVGAGFAIGTAITGGNPVGGFVGATIGSIVSGRVICTELVTQGEMDPQLLRHDLWHAIARIDAETIRGYHFWAFQVVKWMRRQDAIGAIAVAIAKPLATWRARECAFQMGFSETPCWEGRLIRAIGEPICRWIGRIVDASDLRDLYPQHSR